MKTLLLILLLALSPQQDGKNAGIRSDVRYCADASHTKYWETELTKAGYTVEISTKSHTEQSGRFWFCDKTIPESLEAWGKFWGLKWSITFAETNAAKLESDPDAEAEGISLRRQGGKLFAERMARLIRATKLADSDAWLMSISEKGTEKQVTGEALLGNGRPVLDAAALLPGEVLSQVLGGKLRLEVRIADNPRLWEKAAEKLLLAARGQGTVILTGGNRLELSVKHEPELPRPGAGIFTKSNLPNLHIVFRVVRGSVGCGEGECAALRAELYDPVSGETFGAEVEAVPADYGRAASDTKYVEDEVLVQRLKQISWERSYPLSTSVEQAVAACEKQGISVMADDFPALGKPAPKGKEPERPQSLWEALEYFANQNGYLLYAKDDCVWLRQRNWYFEQQYLPPVGLVDELASYAKETKKLPQESLRKLSALNERQLWGLSARAGKRLSDEELKKSLALIRACANIQPVFWTQTEAGGAEAARLLPPQRAQLALILDKRFQHLMKDWRRVSFVADWTNSDGSVELRGRLILRDESGRRTDVGSASFAVGGWKRS